MSKQAAPPDPPDLPAILLQLHDRVQPLTFSIGRRPRRTLPVYYERQAVLELEDVVGKSIVFHPEVSYPIDVVHHRFLTGDGQEARTAIPAGLGKKA